MPVALRAIRSRALRPAINREHINISARRSIRQYLEEVKEELQLDYQAVTPSPTYTRTHRLFRGWKINVPSNYFGELTNSERAATFVQGPRNRQAIRMRRRGWQSISDVARRLKGRFVELTNRSIRG